LPSDILGVNYGDLVRNRLGVTEADLPNTLIDTVIPAVEAKIKKRVVNWNLLTGDAKTFLDAATVAAIAEKCCSILKTKLPQREQSPFYAAESAQDWDALQKQLAEEKEEYLGYIAGYTSVPMFTVFGPTRAADA